MKAIWNPPKQDCSTCYFFSPDSDKPYCNLGFPMTVKRMEGRANYVKPQNETPCLKAVTALGAAHAVKCLEARDAEQIYKEQCEKYNTTPNWLREDAKNHSKRPLLAHTKVRP